MAISQNAMLSRRTLLQVGYSGLLGLGMSSTFAKTAVAEQSRSHLPTRSPRSIIIVFLTGAASHHDTFDLKPNAPAEIRGDFKPVSTSIPGLHVCEHLPKLAARANQYAVLRTLSHGDNNHLMSTHHVLTGMKQPGGFFDKVASRDDWPSYSSASAYLQPRRDGIPSGVNLPTFLLQGPLTWPGQHAGFLGPKYDPWQITGDPNKKNFRVDSLQLAPGVDVTRLKNRQALLGELNRQQTQLESVAEARRMSDDQQVAFSILTSSKLARAFELDRENQNMRDRYGRTTTGQSLLLARRLVQVGVPVVQVNVGRVQTWDNHSNIFPTLKNRLLPPLDQGVATLLDDLESQGMLDDTLVMMLGEFGRTPKINKNKGRDHWGPCFFGVFAGAGVRGGQVIGKSDSTGAYPLTTPFSPDDVGATVYATLGIPLETEVRDRLNRPVRLNRGKVIRQLFT
ncbi:MAG: DUF1501 domain-containing protein [Planctomycetaceae bacterium]